VVWLKGVASATFPGLVLMMLDIKCKNKLKQN